MRSVFVLGGLLLLVSVGAHATAAPVECGSATSLAQQLGLAVPGSHGVPEPVFLSFCESSIDCYCVTGNFVTIYCYGSNSCTHNFRSVTCDGQTTYCPPVKYC